ncbi:unnamed protein product [Clonostachys solani]|uniref:Uncharacterized protein n=1 Tax=Clonostachys solani TaxID=160281 RepID=A0A9N9YYI3_9HYPO|nr:unnamed protein product [Clonostachys solani]
MHLLNPFAALFLSTTFAGHANGAAVTSQLSTENADTPFTDLGLSAQFWAKMSAYCAQRAPKRDTSQSVTEASMPDGYDLVKPDAFKSYPQVIKWDGAWTEHLVTCYGLVVVGDSVKPTDKDKLLAHFFAIDHSMDTLWNKIKAEIGSQGQKNLRAWLSAPEVATAYPDLPKADIQKLEDKMKAVIKSFTGKDATVRHHNMQDVPNGKGDIGTMQLNNEDKSVKIDGKLVPFGG